MIHPRPRGPNPLSLRAWVDRFAFIEASSLAEFAVALPLLVVLVVGIFDFGGAFNQKQELNAAVREGARLGASQPTNDLAYTTAPSSIDAVRYLVDTYLLNSKINDCGLGANGLTSSSGPPWVYTTTGTCPSQLTLTIAKDPEFGTSPTGNPTCSLLAPLNTYGSPNPLPKVYVACTLVTISYPYQWHFNSVIQVLVPGSTIALTQIVTSATVPNMN
ncbi:MAG: TadE/TadG family type IV pilus assembly protein [Terriglobales bacterium]